MPMAGCGDLRVGGGFGTYIQNNSKPYPMKLTRPRSTVAVLLALSIVLLVLPVLHVHSSRALGVNLARFESSTEQTIELRSLVGDRWTLVCATSVAFGTALAETVSEQAALKRIDESARFLDTETDWRLSVFEEKGGVPTIYTLSRQKHPFNDGPLAAKNYPHFAIQGTPVLCTDKKDAVLSKISDAATGRQSLTLIEP